MNTEHYDAILNAAITIPEDNSRLQLLLNHLPSQCQTLFLGGSITYGFTGYTMTTPFPNLVVNKLNERFAPNFFQLHNEGHCCFHTHLGIALLDLRLKSLKPDLVFLEYAVNNGYNLEYASSFEGMIQKLLHVNPFASIIIVCSCDQQGYSCENYMAEIARFYHLPMVSVKSALDYGKDFGFSWGDYSEDNCHPTQTGQQFLADCILKILESSKQAPQQSDLYIPQKPCFSDLYANATFYPCSEIKELGSFEVMKGDSIFTSSIRHIPGSNEVLTLKLSFHKLFLLFEQSCNIKEAGQLEIHISSMTDPVIINGYSICGWDNPNAAFLFEDEYKEHELSIQMKSSDQLKSIRIYGFLAV